jgi:transformation/transcription domain-associated protein
MTLEQILTIFRDLRDRLEIFLDYRPRKTNVEHVSHYLTEFEYLKFDDLEVPGQYCKVD